MTATRSHTSSTSPQEVAREKHRRSLVAQPTQKTPSARGCRQGQARWPARRAAAGQACAGWPQRSQDAGASLANRCPPCAGRQLPCRPHPERLGPHVASRPPPRKRSRRDSGGRTSKGRRPVLPPGRRSLPVATGKALESRAPRPGRRRASPGRARSGSPWSSRRRWDQGNQTTRPSRLVDPRRQRRSCLRTVSSAHRHSNASTFSCPPSMSSAAPGPRLMMKVRARPAIVATPHGEIGEAPNCPREERRSPRGRMTSPARPIYPRPVVHESDKLGPWVARPSV